MPAHGLIVVVAPHFKVHRGVPGFIDWRSHGRLNRFVSAGVYSAEEGEWLMFGQPLGQLVGSVLLGSCPLPVEAKSAESLCRRWAEKHCHVWEKLHFEHLYWSVSEEWQSAVELWKPLFHNGEYVDVSRLRELEERNYNASSRENDKGHRQAPSA